MADEKTPARQITDGQIRHILTAVGGILVAFGIMDESEASNITDAVVAAAGAVSIAVGAIWSFLEKKGRTS